MSVWCSLECCQFCWAAIWLRQSLHLFAYFFSSENFEADYLHICFPDPLPASLQFISFIIIISFCFHTHIMLKSDDSLDTNKEPIIVIHLTVCL